ncbi:DNA-binding protein WhiA [Corynebacterium mendelii]
MTLQVKEELAAARSRRPDAKAAEAIALVRFAGEMGHSSHGPYLVCEFDIESVARRAAELVTEVFEVPVTVTGSPSQSNDRIGKWYVEVNRGLDLLLTRSGLVGTTGRRIVGLPPHIVSGNVSEAEAVWRGAFLAHGCLTEPGRSCALEITCPCTEAALALVGCARRLGIVAKTKETRGSDRVLVRDGEAIGALLTRMGAQHTRLKWEEKRLRREVRATANRLANFDNANQQRSARAAVKAAARVERAMEILGDDVPEHLADAGELRIRHKFASLEELGKLADPQMTKDAIAGRIRRLCATADKRAAELGIPSTKAAVTEQVLAEADPDHSPADQAGETD